MPIRAHHRCEVCKVQRAGQSEAGCARGQDASDGICDSMKANLYEKAIMRLLLPDAFDAAGRIDPSRYFNAKQAAWAELQKMARLYGPMLVAPAHDS